MYMRINIVLTTKKNIEKDPVASIHLADLSVP